MCEITIIFVTTVIILAFGSLKLLKSLKHSLKNKYVVITGCDSGFGFNLSKRLADKGASVICGCLFPNQGGAEELAKYSRNITILPLDVSKDESVENFKLSIEKICPRDKGIWALVNNAGICFVGDIELSPMTHIDKQFQVNLYGPIRVTKALLSLIRKARGRVVTVASSASYIRFPCFSVYCMSKAAILCFNDCLRLEMKKFGVKTMSIEPGPYRTNIVDLTKIHATIDEIWNASDESVRSAYPTNHVEEFKKMMTDFNKQANPNLSHVINCMEHAISAYFPYRHYPTPFSVNFLKLVFNIFPSCLTDRLLPYFPAPPSTKSPLFDQYLF